MAPLMMLAFLIDQIPAALLWFVSRHSMDKALSCQRFWEKIGALFNDYFLSDTS